MFGKPVWSRAWWLLTFVSLYVAEITFYNIVRYFRKSTPDVPAPEPKPQFTREVVNTKDNFCAISSKPLALWESPTFLYYLVVSGIRNLQMYAEETGSLIELSDKTEDKEEFFKKSLELADTLGKEETPDHYYGLRLLVYPEETYKERKDFIITLLEVHQISRIHCIPIVKEELEEKLGKNEIRNLNEFAKELDSDTRINESRGASLIPDFLHSSSSSGASLVPDFLITNNKRDKQGLGWYTKSDSYYRRFDQSREKNQTASYLFSTVCKYAKETSWGVTLLKKWIM